MGRKKIPLSYYERHKEEKKAYQREYQRAHRQEAIALHRQWRKDHPDKWREICRNNMHRYYYSEKGKHRYATYYLKNRKKLIAYMREYRRRKKLEKMQHRDSELADTLIIC